MTQNPWVSWVLGVGLALAVHVMKATARPVVNVSTAGMGAPGRQHGGGRRIARG